MKKEKKMTYSEKLRDPKWQKMRLKIMERDGFHCQECQCEDQTLNVHHRFYRKGASPWDYEETALVTLCEACHEKAEKERDFIQQACAGPSMKQEFVARILKAQDSSIEGFCPFLDSAICAFDVFLEQAEHIRQLSRYDPCSLLVLNDAFRQVVVTLGQCVTETEIRGDAA